jgi:hypothetical protein
MNLRLTTCLFACAALLSGCDQGVDPGPSPEFRETTSCLKTGTSTTTLAVKTGVPNDWDPHGEIATKVAPEQADEFIVAYARMDPKNESLCTEICAGEKLDWTGENCVADRDYTVGEYEVYENGDGEKRYRIPVDTGKTLVGCACE